MSSSGLDHGPDTDSEVRNESTPLLLFSPSYRSRIIASPNSSSNHSNSEQEENERPASSSVFGPRTILRALSVPLSAQTLFTKRDSHVGRPRLHPLLVREPHVTRVPPDESRDRIHVEPLIEKLNPHPTCASRKSTVFVALFNLVATVCGGGVLSLPLVFARAGIGPTTVLLLLGAAATDVALQRLVDSARITGARSYGDVAQAAFGKAASIVTTATLAVMLVGSLIAFLVLTRDVWAPVLLPALGPVVEHILSGLRKKNDAGGYDDYDDDDGNASFSWAEDRQAADALLLCILVAALPLMLKRELYALRHTCYVGFGSCVLLCVAICVRAIERVQQCGGDLASLHLKWWSTDIADWLFAFPIVALCFFCSYNVLPVHSQLLNPTRPRIAWVLRSSMILCCILFYLVGLGGYVYAHPYTPDNIITAFPMSDLYVLAGRMGYCLTLLFGVPLILLPCREAWVSIPGQIKDWRRDQALIAAYRRKNQQHATKDGQHFVVNGVDFDEPYSFFQRKEHHRHRTYSTTSSNTSIGTASSDDDHIIEEGYRSVAEQQSLPSVAEFREDEVDDTFRPLFVRSGAATRETTTAKVVSPEQEVDAQKDESSSEHCECNPDDKVSHWIVTLLLLTVTYITAISVPGVAAVWSIFGSSMALFIAFVVPTACYLQIVARHKGTNVDSFFAWTLLIVSVATMFLCTHQAVSSAINGTL